MTVVVSRSVGTATPPRPPRLRVGVLGTGYWAWWCHGSVLAAHPGVDFVGFWGRDHAKAQEVAGRVAGRAFADVDELLDQVDAVAIAVPPDVQPDLAVKAAEAGKDLILDKPLALDLFDADAVVDATNVHQAVTLTFLTYLFQPAVQEWLAAMERLAARSGPWSGASVACAGSIDLPGSPYSDSTWRRERGGLWDWGPHALSVVQSLLPLVEGVAATRGARDTTNVNLEHVDGSGSTMTLSVTASEAAQTAEVEVWGPAGRFGLTLPAGGLRSAYRAAVDDFIAAARTRRPHLLDAAYSRDIVAILQTAQDHLTRADRVSQPPPPRRRTHDRPSSPPTTSGSSA